MDGQGNPHRNPIHYVVVTADDGVGVKPGSTQYRVGLRQGNTTNWLTSWTSVGAATAIGPGVDRYDVGIFSNLVAGLNTTEGIYDVEFRTTDRLERTSTAARCFDLHLRAPPLHFVATTAPHSFRLESMGLEAGKFHTFATRLLNNDATGASLIDEDVTNGTSETVYLEIAVSKPAEGITISQKFVLANFRGPLVGTDLLCLLEEGGNPANCEPPMSGPVYQSPLITEHPTGLSFPAKVFELNAAGAPTTEVPCLVCGAQEVGSVRQAWKFAIPPRTGSAGALQPPRRFKAMTMLGQTSGLWPRDAAHDQGPPFVDASLGGRFFTGRTESPDVGCGKVLFNPEGLPEVCQATQQFTPYRALLEAHVAFSGEIKSVYRTASTPQLRAVQATDDRSRSGFSYSTTITQAALP